jgi:uncharacterized membrane protein YeaQ/YmgE (transglycosylase-associated protein family)
MSPLLQRRLRTKGTTLWGGGKILPLPVVADAKRLFIRNVQQRRNIMPLLLWIIEGLFAGWLMGKIMASEGRDRVMNIVMGGGGGVAGGLIISVAPILVSGKMIYTNLAATSGAMLLVFLSRYIGGSREYGRAN